MIAPKTVQEVIDTAKIEEVVQDFVNLKRTGANMKGLCPFHNEKTPSFTVSPSKNLFKCFGCGKGGTPVTFVMEHETMTYPEAIRYLAKKYNIEIEEKEISQEDREAMQWNDSLYVVNEFAKQFFFEQLTQTDKGKSIGLSYFKERGYRDETIQKFGLGYAPEGRDTFTKYALSKGHKLDMLKSLGLTTSKDTDFFWNRVMFTIYNLSGKPVAFAGRIMQKGVKIAKYINSPETEIYNKSKTVYGLYQAKTAIRKLDECILVEGYTDVMTLSQAGIENVVASSGTALTQDQLRMIKRFTPNLKILYDGDSAGVKAALRGLDLALEQDLNVKIVLLPEGEDPDSYLQNVGAKAFQEYIDSHSRDFILFKIELLMEDAKNDPVKKADLVKDILGSIARIPDNIKRSIYVQECARLMQMEEESLLRELNKLMTGRAQKEAQRLEVAQRQAERDQPGEIGNVPGETIPDTRAVQGPATGKKHEFQERDIVRILVSAGDKWYNEEETVTVGEFVLDNIEEIINSFDNKAYQNLVQEAKSLLKKSGKVSPQYFINHQDKDIADLAIDLMHSPFEYSPGWGERNIYLKTQKMPDDNYMRDSTHALKIFKLRKIEKLYNENQERLREMKDASQLDILLKVQMKLMTMRNDLAKELNIIVLR
ncbi:MAG: DNA primase [Saprospiraceae bacterium]|nr:DNA primase [Saprospiraceae bacterium]